MFYKINGRAGHGKTHLLVQDIQARLAQGDEDFMLVTPTNKSALIINARLAKAGLPRLAKTLHSSLYYWVNTGRIKNVRKIRAIDPATGKFAKDAEGKPVYKEEIEYEFIRELKDTVEDKDIIVDESSMVESQVWFDLITSGLCSNVYAYGDERQLPPIERYEDLSPELVPYYRYWHNFAEEGCVITLTTNYRHKGDLKDIVETIETSLFSGAYSSDIPSNLHYGNSFTTHANDLTETELLTLIEYADAIITPYNKVRQLVNAICRLSIAKKAGKKFELTPVVGDKIIFADAIYNTRNVGDRTIKELYMAKNVTAVITAVHDISLLDGSAIIDCTDETGVQHAHLQVGIKHLVDPKFTGVPRKIEYAYAVTVHKSQGAQWGKVLFLNGHWPGEDAKKLRYVGITRAQEELMVVNGIMNTTEAADAHKSIIVRVGQQLGWK
jgi:ATP-dependent exoDNAse (exonuclease V) alpha subunit